MSEMERLETLEVKVTHLERGLQELSDVVIRQQREINALAEHNRVLAGRLQALLEQMGPPEFPQETPQHY
jgi:uncharacterized coiled-coil protein SlyX